MNEQKEKHIQAERNKIRAKRTEKALEDAKKYKEEEKNTYRIVTKREYTFAYTIRAKNEEDAMIRTLKYVSQDGSGQYLQGPMQLGKPLIREWIDKIEKL